MPAPTYRAEAVRDGDDALVDLILHLEGEKRLRLGGPHAPARERALLEPLRKALAETPERPPLPVLLGAGMGVALAELAGEGPGETLAPGRPVIVVDREAALAEVSGLRARYADREDVLWLSPTPDEDPQRVLAALTRLQLDNDAAPFSPIVNPTYQRLDPAFYGSLRHALEASTQADFWSRARYPRFTSHPPRVLLLTSKYFLMGEITAACERLAIPHRLIALGQEEVGSTQFVEALLTAVHEFKPDFVFTINHLGVDREGVLMELMDRLKLPLASWFVDNPHLILYFYTNVVSERALIFTWDADNLETLRALGFPHVRYLPLATDHHRFTPPAHPETPLADVAFVGNSMVYKVAQRMAAARPPKALLRGYRDLAAHFADHEERNVRRFLERERPELEPHFLAMQPAERQLAFEAMLTWEATRQYRLRCLQGVMDFNPLIAGDRGWKITLRHETRPWRRRTELAYYDELPRFYPRVAVNFNATSKQMKGAVNQRVFDCPASGAFVLTDWREQMDRLFDPGTEVVAYHSPEEAHELAARYLRDVPARRAVAAAARARILAEHTYDHRVMDMLAAMRDTFA